MEDEKTVCPVCGSEAVPVSDETVRSLVNLQDRGNIKPGTYFACMGEECPVIYIGYPDEKIIYEDGVRVPIWYKKNASPKYACYCSKVTFEDIRKAVKEKGARDVETVNMVTGAMRHSLCRRKNPLGRCCYNTVKKIIDETVAEIESEK